MCDDSTNNDACEYDGGDCCGNSVNDQYCSECICHESGDTSNANLCPENLQVWVGDTFCDDDSNNEGMLIVKQKSLGELIYTCKMTQHGIFSRFSQPV